MPLVQSQHDWLQGVIAGLTALSDNRLMMPSNHLVIILRELASIIERRVHGAIVEMGCAGGRTTLKLAAFLRILREGRTIHVYDSFEGFPPPHQEVTAEYDFRYTDINKLFAEWGDCLPAPTIHAGFFNEADDNHPESIALSLIDCDVSESIRTALKIVWPRLAHGGTVIVHDYDNSRWPGVKKECIEWFREHYDEIDKRKIHETLMIVTKK